MKAQYPVLFVLSVFSSFPPPPPSPTTSTSSATKPSPRGIFTVYLRDLDSSVDRTFGLGAGVRGLRLGRIGLGLSADVWDEPEAPERLYEGSGWNATAEVDALLSDRWGLSAKVGSKSEGFLPGLPIEDGVYFGFGVLGGW